MNVSSRELCHGKIFPFCKACRARHRLVMLTSGFHRLCKIEIRGKHAGESSIACYIRSRSPHTNKHTHKHTHTKLIQVFPSLLFRLPTHLMKRLRSSRLPPHPSLDLSSERARGSIKGYALNMSPSLCDESGNAV
jgi:hypothetical protein